MNKRCLKTQIKSEGILICRKQDVAFCGLKSLLNCLQNSYFSDYISVLWLALIKIRRVYLPENCFRNNAKKIFLGDRKVGLKNSLYLKDILLLIFNLYPAMEINLINRFRVSS